MSILIDFNVICIVCLKEERGDIKLRSVFQNDEQTTKFTIAQKIMFCSDLNVDKNAGKMPDKICNVCLSDLRATWRFRSNCEAAQKLFISLRKNDDETTSSGLELEETNSKPIKSDVQVKNETGNPLHKLGIYIDSGENDVDLEEYYETEEVLEEETMENMDSVSSLSAQEENSCEKTTVRVRNEAVTEGEDDDDESIDENMPLSSLEKGDIKYKFGEHMLMESELLLEPTRRNRGRPKKLLNTGVASGQSGSQNENDEDMSLERTEKKALSGSTNNMNFSMTSKPGSRRKFRPKGGIRQSGPKICNLCGNSYKFQHSLDAHMRRHNNVRPYPCEFCEKAFVSTVELRRHMRVHTGDKPYACSYCDRRFSDFGSRIKHERTHTGERPYSCETCGKSFAYAHVLTVHLRTHTGEKKFRCSLCEKGFTKKAYLESHLASHGITKNSHTNIASTSKDQKPLNIDVAVVDNEDVYMLGQGTEVDPDDIGKAIIKQEEEEEESQYETFEVREVDDEGNYVEEHLETDSVENVDAREYILHVQ